ncbi:hypothetical protein DHEL01_v208906 [Diaporthe helianthi]|uniref:Uncharacterized protein n=1 Tax=Diaporthe helianthi TaxID=158607 RepID=A0A2P5HR37_DIAHE|nr:hypothetical protein DHEL01_v208906 [Diaporthe helianthi]
MPLNVLILPKTDAVEAARAATTRVRVPTDALVLHVFCDASHKNGNYIRKTSSQAALAVVVNTWPPKASTYQRTSKACFITSNDPKDSSVTAEAFALAEGVHVAIDQRFQHIVDIIELKARDLQRLRQNVSVQFVWCPEECVEPHKTADEMSKRVRISGGSGTQSKALYLFRRLPYGAIQSALEQPHTDISQSEVKQSTDACVPATADGYDMIRSAVLQLSAACKEMELAAIKLQEMADILAMQDQTKNEIHNSESQDNDSAGKVYEREDHCVEYEGQDPEQNGIFNEDEDRFYDAQEPGDREGGEVDGEFAMAGDSVGRPSRMRALWNWVRGRPLL